MNISCSCSNWRYVRGETEIINKRESKSHPDRGIVWFDHRGYNQKGELVVTAKRAALMIKSK